jgi:chitin disaccharide deacetylase
MGGLVVSPMLRALDHHDLDGISTQVKARGFSRSPSPIPPNPLLKQLGFNDTDRVVIIELEDLGLCEANLAAFYELVDFGLVTSERAIVPSAWFPQVAHFARTHPGVDIGANLTLISELQPIRWRPLSTVDPVSNLPDDQGYFPLDGVPATISDPQAIAQELSSQIQRAQIMGVRLTHLAVRQQYRLNPTILPSVLQVAQEARLPLVFLRPDEFQWGLQSGINEDWLSAGMDASTQLSQQGAPLLDSIVDLSSADPDARLAHTRQALDDLGAGVHLISLHAGKDTPELRALTPDWKTYVADYLTWTSQDLAAHMRDTGIQVTQWKAILATMGAG